MQCKKLKDPIYGYVHIPVEYVTDIIDTAEFQRLRRIVQTSYSPLYSSAIHNRFVHSIGVFYLSGIASEQMINEIVEKGIMERKDVEKIAEVYRLACLLHDVGHAPFSHTGECFYKNENFQSVQLHDRIAELVEKQSFAEFLKKQEARAAAPHELMSVIIGIKNYKTFLQSPDDKEFFARCITGYEYENPNKEEQIKNCFISMLNSKVIDVDRLDYLIRDAYITGFETVDIDYERLLNALTIVNYNGKYQIAYKKGALSIIENVAYAHDAERKWIQNHPVVLYEAYIIKHIIMLLNEKLNTSEGRLFSEAALSSEGVILNKKIKISLLCDDDLVYLYKNMFIDELSSEYLNRQNRRHPIWKSEAEYLGYMDGLGGEKLNKIFDEYISTMTKGEFKDIPSFTVIDDAFIKKIKKELKDAKKAQEEMNEAENDIRQSLENNITGIKRRLAFCKCLKQFANKNKMKCDFVILKTNMFNSNFSKEYLRKTLIVFKDGGNENVFPIDKVCSTLKAEKVDGDMFYIFCRKDQATQIEGIKEFCKDLFLDTVGTK